MDNRYETFLMLCQLMNYRKTAEILHLTQPAVTRQIQSLEEELDTRLFNYDHRKLQRTEASYTLEDYILATRHNYDSLREELKEEKLPVIRVGATKTIGNYVITGAVKEYISDGQHNIMLQVDNTETLLSEIRESKIDFAIVEGVFDKEKYAYRLLKEEEYTGICAKNHPFAGREVKLTDIFGENLIIREKGSGTRDILERELQKRGYSINLFARVSEIGSFPVITRLVTENCGVSFAYTSVVRGLKEAAVFKVRGFDESHEFNIVWLKNTCISKEGDKFLSGIDDRAADEYQLIKKDNL